MTSMRHESTSTDANSSMFVYSSLVLTEASFDEDEFKARMAIKLVRYGEPKNSFIEVERATFNGSEIAP